MRKPTISIAPSPSRNGVSSNGAPAGEAANPDVSYADMIKLGKLIRMYSVHPEAMRVISHTLGDKENVANAIKRGQTEMLIIPIDTVPESERGFVIRTLYAVRGKEPPSARTIEGLPEKKFMLVHESSAISALKAALKSSYISTDKKQPTGIAG